MNKHTPFGIITAILFALLPFVTSRHLFYGAVNAKAFFVIGAVLMLATLAAWVLWEGKRRVELKNKPLLWSVVALLGVYWLSALFGVFFERSVFSDIQRSSGVFFLTHLTLFAVLISEFFTERDWTLVRRTVIVSAGIFGLLSFLGVEGLDIEARFLWTNLEINGYTFGNSTFAGTYLLLALVAGLIELTRTTFRSRMWYLLTASAVLTFLSPILFNLTALTELSLPIGSARASSAAAVLVLVFFAGYWLIKKYAGRIRYALPAWAVLLLLVIGVGVALLFTPGSAVQEQYVKMSTAARIFVWDSGFAAFKDRPLLGWGPENYEQATQAHFDNRLFEKRFIGEIWFDRAHNVIVDTLVGVGLVGAVASLGVGGVFLWVVYRARRRGLVGEGEAALLYALPFAHFLQLQTGFDSIGSYALLGFFAGYGLWLERGLLPQEKPPHRSGGGKYAQVAAGVLALFVLASMYVTFAEFSRQHALYRTFVEPDFEKQVELIRTSTSRLSSFESLRFSSFSLAKGIVESIGEQKATGTSIQHTLEQLDIFEDRYRAYIEREPDYYRARTALAYLLSLERVLGGENKLDEAKELLARGYELSPNNLLTPALEALIELYSGNIAAARSKAEEMVALNPDAEFGKEVLTHIEKQAETFPNISILKLENL